MLVKELNKHYRELQKWASECYEIVTANEEIMHKTPNKDSLHYKAALEASEEISKLWFVSEVILFGSVAKGEEKPESDIDLMFKIGFDTSMLTEARNTSLVRLVTRVVEKVERKYEKLMEAYPQKGVFPYSKKQMFNFLSISMSSKSDLKMYKRTGFFDNAITLFKREQFEFRVNDLTETILYSDIECAIVPTRGSYTLFAKVIHDNEKYRYIQYYKYDFESQFSNVEPYYDESDYKNYKAQAILVQKLDKSKGISYHFRSNLDYHNMFVITSKRDYDKFSEEELNTKYPHYVNSIDEYDDIHWTYFVPMNHEISTGGVRMVKKNTPHFFRVEEQRHRY